MIFNDVALVHGKHLCQALSVHPCISLEGVFFFSPFADTACVVMRIVFIGCTLCLQAEAERWESRSLVCTSEAFCDAGVWERATSALKVVVDSLLA